MTSLIKENLFIGIATLFLGFTLAFSFTANAQTSGGCDACGGDAGSGDCYEVDAGASVCTPIGDDCSQAGECENGNHKLPKVN